ncbi:MAG: LysM peptidoglycan-binding domain-containing protein [Deltaproteobacteria bacterium]|nr:LysM peptidoglycan-binding domain-containing protein [Deltaproteobacteria bacterium]
MDIKKGKAQSVRWLHIWLFLVCVMLSAACSSRSSIRSPGGVQAAHADGYVAEDYADFDDSVLVEYPNLPADDGIPLTAAERQALHSTGELDRSLTADQKKQVERHFKYFLRRNRAGFQVYLQRAEGYLPYVKQVLREKGLPEELASLALVESGFNCNAVSRSGATGMWQFMRYTGTRYGLIQNYWTDERRDPYKATEAAANYLKQLYEYFGDWHLAIASYNGGEGKISRALQHTGAESFFELSRLNKDIAEYKLQLRPETQQYVPRFLAVVKIMRNLELLGFQEPDPARAYDLVAIKVGPGADLSALARQAGLSYADFKALNPAYRQKISPVSGHSTAYVPGKSRDKCLAWLAKPQARSFAGWQQYKVRRGDSLYALSQRHGVPIETLRQANNLKGSSLREGATLLVPGGGKAAPAPVAKPTQAAQKQSGSANKNTAQKSNAQNSLASSSGQPGSASAGRVLHTVQRGENLYQISRAYNVSLSALQTANKMSAADSFVLVGQKLVIPGPGEAGLKTAVAAGKSRIVVVRKGDTLYSLAQKNNTSVDKLIQTNKLGRNAMIKPGQKLLLP